MRIKKRVENAVSGTKSVAYEAGLGQRLMKSVIKERVVLRIVRSERGR